jgi:putative heme iron utilization protein
MTVTDPIRPTDETARNLAKSLLDGARWAALSTLDETGHPSASLVSFALDQGRAPVLLVSALSSHTVHLKHDPRCALLVGEPGKGDPLAHPRVTISCKAQFVARPSGENDRLRPLYLARQPKAELYIDFGDFTFVKLEILSASLNGGFGKAYRLTPDDLR